jgi:hypothetical protein
VNIPEYVLAAILALFGIRSLRHWIRRPFDARTFGEHVLFVLHATARVGIWFTLAAFFLGYALVDEDRSAFVWYAMVPIALAAVQLLTSLYLSRSEAAPPEG